MPLSDRLPTARPQLLVLLVAFALAGCGGDLQTPGEALRIFGDDLPQAHLNESYEAAVRAVGGLRPFSYELRDGSLPPGLEMVNGVLRGVPTETGTFEFTVMVSDANLSQTFEEYALVVIERPPPQLVLEMPNTQIREPTVVRVEVRNASQLRAVSLQLSWDSEQLELVDGTLKSSAPRAATLSKDEPGVLQVDVAALGAPWEGEVALLEFVLSPMVPLAPVVATEAIFLDDRGGEHFERTGTAEAAQEAAGDDGSAGAETDTEDAEVVGDGQETPDTDGETEESDLEEPGEPGDPAADQDSEQPLEPPEDQEEEQP